MEVAEQAEGDKAKFEPSEIEYVSYGGEHHLPLIMRLVDDELSEPYSIFTYRYFVYLWPQLCFLAFHRGRCVGTVVCKMGDHRHTFRGYIAMLVVIKPYRGKGIGQLKWWFTQLSCAKLPNLRCYPSPQKEAFVMFWSINRTSYEINQSDDGIWLRRGHFGG